MPQNKSTPNRTISYYIVMLLMLMTYFILPKLPLLEYAPINFIYFIVCIFIFLNIGKLFELDIKTKLIFVLMVMYAIFYVLSYYHKYDAFASIGSFVRMFIYLLISCIAIRNLSLLYSGVKWFLFIACLTAIFGLLVYFIGEPFASWRVWMMQSGTTASTQIISRGSQLAGPYCAPYVYGYLLAATPILASFWYMIRPGIFTALALMLLCITLVFNAERSALLMNAAVFGVSLLSGVSQGRGKYLIVLLCILGLGALTAKKLATFAARDMVGKVSYAAGPLGDRLKVSTSEEFVHRLLYQLHGVEAVLQHPLAGPTDKEYLEIAGSDEDSVVAIRTDYEGVFAPHNYYVNAGIHAGIMGWVIVLALLTLIVFIALDDNRYARGDQKAALLNQGVNLALYAVLGNAIFHNAGLLMNEVATTTILGFFLAKHEILRRSANDD